MTPSHDMLVFVAKTFGLFYLIAFALAATIHTLRPSMRARHDKAARDVLDAEDGPCS